MAKLRNLELAAVDVLAGRLAALDGAEALLELAVILRLLVVLGVLHVDVGALIIGLGAGQKPLEVLGKPLAAGIGARRVVHIVCHVILLLRSWSPSCGPFGDVFQVPHKRTPSPNESPRPTS